MGEKPIVLRPETTITENLKPHVRRVLEAVGHPAAFCTDRSLVGDFFAYDEICALAEGRSEEDVDGEIAGRLAVVAYNLRVPVRPLDRVVDVAARLEELERETADEQ